MAATPVAFAPGDVSLPAFGPIAPERPEYGSVPEQDQQVAMGVMCYADRRREGSSGVRSLRRGGRAGRRDRCVLEAS